MNGMISVGPGTKLACDNAIKLARVDAAQSIIIATAGNAGPLWYGAVMSRIMRTYIHRTDPSIRVTAYAADSFNTSGEMKMLAKVVYGDSSIEEIILAVKDWHAPRAKFLCRFWLWKYGCPGVKVSVSTYPQPVPCRVLCKEYVCAWPKNLFRVLINIFKSV